MRAFGDFGEHPIFGPDLWLRIDPIDATSTLRVTFEFDEPMPYTLTSTLSGY